MTTENNANIWDENELITKTNFSNNNNIEKNSDREDLFDVIINMYEPSSENKNKETKDNTDNKNTNNDIKKEETENTKVKKKKKQIFVKENNVDYDEYYDEYDKYDKYYD